ncbi:type II toxin-antitoxin system HicA family toxin [Sphingomonas sp. EC-HK361]|uniref:type II toxin-antitoxin system HicA family toxin n=1 Tax=Sphingomonas sp. EC-HK361 TaxID=2038397 RepID=UPI00125F0FC1|nr:type II toxin-antitoxin system HicA family toxin [Sphingomonas sp. EC-HK361]
MTQIEKLYAALLSNRRSTITFRDFERLLRAFGFEHARTSGSHRQYTHPNVPRPFPVQPTGKDAKPYQVRELFDMIDEYGLSMDE